MSSHASIEIRPQQSTSLFTGEQTQVDRVAEEILNCWHKSTESILNLARACAGADQELPPSAKKALIAKLPFDRSTFARLVGIGKKHQRLCLVSGQLPQKFSVLYELAKFDDTQFDAALKSGAIHPAVTRQDVLTLAGTSKLLTPGDARRKTSKLEALQNLWHTASEGERQQFLTWCDRNVTNIIEG